MFFFNENNHTNYLFCKFINQQSILTKILTGKVSELISLVKKTYLDDLTKNYLLFTNESSVSWRIAATTALS